MKEYKSLSLAGLPDLFDAEIQGEEPIVKLVHVRPFQYNPAKRKLIGFGNIAVTITVSPKEGELDEYPLSDPELNREVYGNLFLNPRRRIEERLEIEPVGITISPIPRGPEFLIIYHDTFREAAEKLAKWKILLLHK
jgi:hypothetical protein